MATTMRPYHPLPDELVKEILAPFLHIPDEKFSCNSLGTSPFSTPSLFPCANMLAVCKQWMRVATPLLYQVVVLRSTAQAGALARALKKNPTFGKFIQKLRLEGGFGVAVDRIIQLAPNITNLALSLEIWSTDNVSGLVKCLHLINPKHLVLIDGTQCGRPGSKGPDNSHSRQLTTKLSECIEGWGDLESCNLPYDNVWLQAVPIRNRAEEVIRALAASSSIQTIYLPDSPLLSDLKTLSQSKSLRCVQLRPIDDPDDSADDGDSWYHRYLHDAINLNNRLKELIVFEARDKAPLASESDNVSLMALNPLYTPFASASDHDKERIWGRIIMFALESEGFYDPPNSNQRPLPPYGQPSRQWRCLQLSAVSKLFNRLTEPYLYKDPCLYSGKRGYSLMNTLAQRPALSQHIRSLTSTFRSSIFGCGGDDPAAYEATLRLIFDVLPNLKYHRQAYAWKQNRLSWDILGACPSTDLLRLSGLFLSAPSSMEGFLTLARFESLTELELHCTASSYPGQCAPTFLPTCLNNLERLICSETKIKDRTLPPPTTLLDILHALDLPSLQSFTIKNEAMLNEPARLEESYYLFAEVSQHDSPPDFQKFIIKHGHKLRFIELGSNVGPWSPFDYCTSLENMYIVVGPNPPSQEFFLCTKKHPSVEKITFAYWHKNESSPTAWQDFFDSVNLSAFPSLELHIPACHWPTSE